MKMNQNIKKAHLLAAYWYMNHSVGSVISDGDLNRLGRFMAEIWAQGVRAGGKGKKRLDFQIDPNSADS